MGVSLAGGCRRRRRLQQGDGGSNWRGATRVAVVVTSLVLAINIARTSDVSDCSVLQQGNATTLPEHGWYSP